MMTDANNLALIFELWLDYHVAEQVDAMRYNYWTLCFNWDNLAPVATTMYLVGHIKTSATTTNDTITTPTSGLENMIFAQGSRKNAVECVVVKSKLS